ncbi:MAG: leucine-rich repeat domain-containing protein [Acutalibacteraceae bacterium]
MPAKNKIIFAGETLIDLTGDSVTPETLGKGVTAHDKSGAQIVGTMESGGGGGSLPSATKKDINFYDYDGTILYSYTVDEAAALTELPALPSHDGLICQGWNWSLDGIKSMGRAVNVGAMYITDDGKTRVYIHLEDGRTSPLLGCCPNGTVAVDWGDGTEPDVLTGTSTSTVKWTPTHEYAPGDYVISLTVDGELGFYGSISSQQYSAILRYSSSGDMRNIVYQNAVKKVEIGSGVTSVIYSAFDNCCSLSSITIPDGITSVGTYAFRNCYSLSSITIPDGVTSVSNYSFDNCCSLSSIAIPDGVTSVGTYAFCNCYSLSSITIPDGVTSIREYAFQTCSSLSSITIPDGVTSIADALFYQCNLSSITIPAGVTKIGGYAFYNCGGLRYFDFTRHTVVPTLGTNAIDVPTDCEIRVPAALVDEWKAATNWSAKESYIVGV